MARYRKYRKSKVLTKSNIKSKKSAGSQSTQILALSKKLKTLTTKVNDNTMWTQFQHTAEIIHSGDLLTPSYSHTKLIDPVNWRRIFQSTEISEATNKFRGRSIGIEYLVQLGNAATEPTPVTCTVFICTLRKETARQFIHETNNAANLVEGEHYVRTDLGTLQGSGLVMMNKSIFKIRHTDRFVLGAVTNFTSETNTTSIKDNMHRRYVKLTYKNLIKSDGHSGTAVLKPGYKELTSSEIENTDQIYVFLYANNFSLQTIDFFLNSIITGKVTN